MCSVSCRPSGWGVSAEVSVQGKSYSLAAVQLLATTPAASATVRRASLRQAVRPEER